jgi:hypothetical protein
MDKQVFEKERYDKLTSNSLNIFNSIILTSFQWINIEIFSTDSNTLLPKYHKRMKQSIFNQYKEIYLIKVMGMMEIFINGNTSEKLLV